MEISEFCSKTLHFSVISSRSIEVIFCFHFQGPTLVYFTIHNESRKFLLNVRNGYLNDSPVRTSKFAKHVSVEENRVICLGLKCINCHDILCDLTKTLHFPWLFVERKVKVRPSKEWHPKVLKVTKTLHIHKLNTSESHINITCSPLPKNCYLSLQV